MRYLVTGGAGFIGSHLSEALVARGDGVLLLDDLSTGKLQNVQHLLESPRVEFVEGSVLDSGLVGDCMAAADVCLHLASAVGVQLVMERALDSLLRNVRGSDSVISAAAERGRRLIFTSSSEIYGKNGSAALHEDADRVLGPTSKSRWAYATSKAFAEALIHGYQREAGAEMAIVRLFNTVGPRQSPAYGMVLPRFVRQALASDELTVYGNGTQTRCFVHVLDTVHAILLICESADANGGVYNVGSSTEIPIVELARRVIERVGCDSTVRLVPYADAYPEGFEELGRRRPDTSALEQLTGWEPTRTIDEAIDDVIAFEQSAGDPARGMRVAG
jgi:UDP-glucose 4-epimerase